MSGFLANFRTTMIVSFIIALVIVISYKMHPGTLAPERYWEAVFRWLHVFVGILWIGLLYYFNFVQIRKMPEIPAELKPAISKYIAPEALFWFRWSALLTVLMGLVIAYQRGYLVDALALGLTSGNARDSFIGLGMWLGIIMMINVWGFIWPNQKIALGIVEADADAKAKAGRIAMLFSRTNLLLSVPMLATMTMNQTMFG